MAVSVAIGMAQSRGPCLSCGTGDEPKSCQLMYEVRLGFSKFCICAGCFTILREELESASQIMGMMREKLAAFERQRLRLPPLNNEET